MTGALPPRGRAGEAVPAAGPPWWLRPALAGLGALAAVGALVLVDPFEPHLLACPFHAVTGWWCPGCGSSRAVYLAVHGDLAGSLHHHPLILPILAAFGWWGAGWVTDARRGRRPGWSPSPTALPPGALIALAAGLGVFWVARNLPALDALAPPPS